METSKKYKLIEDAHVRVGDKTVCYIQALRDFSNVKAGDIGGLIESEDNLSHEGDCWVYHDAKVYGNSRVTGDAKVMDKAEVYDNASVCDATVAGNSKVFQKASVYGCAIVDGHASVYGAAQVFGDSMVIGFSRVHEDAWVYGNVVVDGYSNITRKTTIQPITLLGLEYNVTIMDNDISIDCQTKTFDEWRKVTREEAFAMNGKPSLKFFNESFDTFEFLVQKYRKNKSNV